MKLNLLSLVAIILSITAIIVVLFQPTYNFLVNMNTKTGRPSFSLSEGDFTTKDLHRNLAHKQWDCHRARY